MIPLINILCSGVLIMSCLLLARCSDNDPKGTNDRILATWSLSQTGYVKKDDVDVTSDYSGFSISFNENGSYSTTNGGKTFFPSGSWQWSGDNNILLDNEIDVHVKDLTLTQLEIEFYLDEDHVNTGGRIDSFVGDFEIGLVKN